MSSTRIDTILSRGERKLTKAQETFMRDLLSGRNFDNSVLTGSEVSMARRLGDRGLVVYRQRDLGARFGSPMAWKWDLTDAGRAALSQVEGE